MPDVSPELARHYGHYYEAGQTEWRRLSAIGKARNIIGLCAGNNFEKVIEIGAGDGSLLEKLSESDFANTFDAVEISESAVKTILSRNIGRVREVSLFDGSSVPHADGNYDLAILSHVVEHLEHPRQLLKEAGRVASFVWVEVPLELKVRTPRHFEWNSTGHINLYSPKTIRHLLESTGLEVLDEQIVNHSYSIYRYVSGWRAPLHWFVKEISLKFAPPLATSLFTYHWSALCRSLSTGT